MILVTVGTHRQQFNRLVKAADRLADISKEDIVIQYGSSSYIPIHARCFQWTSSQKMEALTKLARVVISQASAGSAIQTVRAGKPLVLVPRLKKYKENHDDHQIQLALALEKKGYAVIVDHPDESTLEIAIDRACEKYCQPSGENKLKNALKSQLAEWSRTIEG
ncbi:MAG: beta-1,4-galactosyltransferase [Chloroflexota bacterium]|nr:MAG: beta-1,4-galactosyltransferase [Chloroflexota bacterium]